MNLSRFAVPALVLLAGCASAPSIPPAAAPAKPVAARPAGPATPAAVIDSDVGPLLSLNLDADDPAQTIPAKTFPTAELAGYRIALGQDLSMPAVKAALIPGADGILQITARVCNRSSTRRTVDFLCQVGDRNFFYVLPQIAFPAHYARDLRIRIAAPDSGTIWLSVRDARGGGRPVAGLSLGAGKPTLSPTIPVPSSDLR